MDRNFILAVALSMLVFTLWSSYQASQQPPPPGAGRTAPADDPAAKPGAEAPLARSLPTPTPAAPLPGSPASAAPASPYAATPAAPAARPDAPAQPSAAPWKRVFQGAKYHAEVTNRGGALLSMRLTDYEEWYPGGKRPVDLLNGEEEPQLVATTPFEELGLGDLRTANFAVEEERADGVTFALSAGGVTLRKRYDFNLSGYDFRLSLEVVNDSGKLLEPRFAVEWPARVREGNEYGDLSFVTRYDGEIDRTAIASVGGSGFLGFGADDGSAKGVNEGVRWFGVDTRYFVGVLAPERVANARAVSRPIRPGELAASILYFDGISLPSGNSIKQELRGFVGPKTDEALESFGAELLASIDRGYSWLEPLTRFFSWLLRVLYGFVGNYGVAIILLTVLVRLVTTPIMQKQMKSMEKMRTLQPRMKELQEKFGDDREKQSQEMMKLYKETGVNPLGGCLPMLLQLPVFIGLFYALQSEIELRHAPFVLWMNDLSAPDALFMIPGLEIPFRVLPLLMAASMVLQAKLQPMSPDPSQAQMMTTVMPLMMLVLFYQFPSGLVLYYMLSNFLGIAHQRWVGRNMQPAAT